MTVLFKPKEATDALPCCAGPPGQQPFAGQAAPLVGPVGCARPGRESTGCGPALSAAGAAVGGVGAGARRQRRTAQFGQRNRPGRRARPGTHQLSCAGRPGKRRIFQPDRVCCDRGDARDAARGPSAALHSPHHRPRPPVRPGSAPDHRPARRVDRVAQKFGADRTAARRKRRTAARRPHGRDRLPGSGGRYRHLHRRGRLWLLGRRERRRVRVDQDRHPDCTGQLWRSGNRPGRQFYRGADCRLQPSRRSQPDRAGASGRDRPALL